MPTAHVDDVELAYELRGEGPRLLLLLGSGMTLEGAGPVLDFIGRGSTLLSFDPRGLGNSSPSPAPYGMATCAADALGLLDAVGWDTARVVGLSFGGMVAQELVVTAPRRVERLALLCTSPGGAGGSSYPLHELEDLEPGARAAARRELLDTRFDEAWLAAHPADRAFVEMMDRRDSDDDPVVVAGRRAQLAARRGHDVWDRLDKVTCPTLVACGRFDPIAPMVNSEAIASRIGGAELARVRGRSRLHGPGPGRTARDRRVPDRQPDMTEPLPSAGAAPVSGHCDERFAGVREAFIDNFADRGELGAGVSVFVDGELVVDMVGGWSDAGGTRPWGADTLVDVYSVGKAFVALLLLQLVDAALGRTGRSHPHRSGRSSPPTARTGPPSGTLSAIGPACRRSDGR